MSTYLQHTYATIKQYINESRGNLRHVIQKITLIPVVLQKYFANAFGLMKIIELKYPCMSTGPVLIF
jgi:hypothetical protein